MHKLIHIFILLVITITPIFSWEYKYIIQNDCPSQFHYLESTLVKSNCDVPFPDGNVTYIISRADMGDRSAPVTNKNQCGAEYTLFEGGPSDFANLLFVDISNIDAFTAGLNVSAFYNDGTVKNIHCCSGCPNTTESPNCWGPGNYWFPTEMEGWGTIAWNYLNVSTLLIQWSCLSQEDLDACNDVTCLNLGVCMGGMRGEGNKGLCLCQPGFEGVQCEVKTDYTPCYGVNCGYYGICNATTASEGGSKCTCREGYSGDLCTTPPTTSACYQVDCGPRGICKNGKCECQAGSSGCGCKTLGECTIIENLDYQGNDIPNGNVQVNTPEECCQQCQKTPLCYAFTLSGDQCYMKSAVPANNGTTQNGKYSGYLPRTKTIDPCVVKPDPTASSDSISGSSTLTVSSIVLLLLILSILN